MSLTEDAYCRTDVMFTTVCELQKLLRYANHMLLTSGGRTWASLTLNEASLTTYPYTGFNSKLIINGEYCSGAAVFEYSARF